MEGLAAGGHSYLAPLCCEASRAHLSCGLTRGGGGGGGVVNLTFTFVFQRAELGFFEKCSTLNSLVSGKKKKKKKSSCDARGFERP